MKNNLYRLFIVLTSSAACVAFGQDIVDAVPVDGNAPLQANPAADKLKIADMLYNQAQAAKSNPQEYRRMMALTAKRYSEFVRENPKSSSVPIALYRLANCLMDSGQTADAYQTLRLIVQQHKGDVAAAAAYRLATEANKTSNWANAERFYLTAIKESTKTELKVDSAYRLGRIYLAQKKNDKAEAQFKSIADNPQASAAFRDASNLAIAALWTEGNKKDAAYELYKKMLKQRGLDVKTRGTVMLHAASLASILNKDEEARQFYDAVIRNPELGGRSAEAQAGLLFGLFKQKKYAEVVKLYDQGQLESNDKLLEAKRRMVVGQACYELKKYDQAILLFTLAEKVNPHTQLAMDAAYRRLLCQKENNDPRFVSHGQQFLNTYARAFPTNQWLDMVRLMMAEALFDSNPQQAVAFYAAINLDKVDPALKPTIVYREAWACAKAGNREKAIIQLDTFIRDFEQDPRVPVAFALRADMKMQTGREGDALNDYETVIKKWPKNDAAAMAWQKSAQIYYNRQDTLNMIKSYEGLIKNFPKAMPSALAEARFNMGMGYFDRKEFLKAVENFEEARTLNPEKYGDQANMRIILSYYQLQDAEKLKAALEALWAKDPKLLETVPETIPAWVGLQAFGTSDYVTADRYLSIAVRNNELKKVKRLIWKNLAKARLALKRYETALVAVDFYLQEETQPYGRVEGQLDKAEILLGLGKYNDARKITEEALAVGVEGPLMASLKIVLGDIAYAEKKYDEAAKQYATTAELFVSDRVLKPEALYKAHDALVKAGRVADAASYKEILDKEFPGWKPSELQQLPGSSQ